VLYLLPAGAAVAALVGILLLRSRHEVWHRL